jgi:hypothetical protein
MYIEIIDGKCNACLYAKWHLPWPAINVRIMAVLEIRPTERCRYFFNSHSGRWSPSGCTRQDGHWMAYCTCPRWLWWWRIWWNEDWQGKPKYSEKTCPSATLSTTNPTWPDPGLNPGRRGEKPASNRLSYGAAGAMLLPCNDSYYVL